MARFGTVKISIVCKLLILLWWRRGELNLFRLLKTRKLLISVLHLFHLRHRFRPRLLNFAHSLRPRDSQRSNYGSSPPPPFDSCEPKAAGRWRSPNRETRTPRKTNVHSRFLRTARKFDVLIDR